MTKDYANKVTKKQPKRQRVVKWIVMVWCLGVLLLIMLMVILIEVIVDLRLKGKKEYRDNDYNHKTIVSEAGQPNLLQENSVHFDFYNASAEKNLELRANSYQLQVKVTHDFALANDLRAQLILLGFAARVEAVKDSADNLVYEISVGPCSSETEALAVQRKLKTMKFTGVLKRLQS